MKIYFAAASTRKEVFNKLNLEFGGFNVLQSFFYKTNIDKILYYSKSLFMDSGAFSAFTQNKEVNIDEYIEYIKTHKNKIAVYAGLDAIHDAEKTLKNQKYMESKGLQPIPCYHLGEPLSYLKHYVENYNYISFGGMAGTKTPIPIIISQLDDIFWNYIVNQETGEAKIKVHGFACTGQRLINRYPWYSVDSTSWVLTAALGSIFCNIGTYNKITISDQLTIKNDHYRQLLGIDRANIKEYLKNIGGGYSVEELETDYRKRCEVNILYFQQLERNINSKPIKFIKSQQDLFM